MNNKQYIVTITQKIRRQVLVIAKDSVAAKEKALNGDGTWYPSYVDSILPEYSEALITEAEEDWSVRELKQNKEPKTFAELAVSVARNIPL